MSLTPEQLKARTLTAERLRSVLACDYATGELRWLVPTNHRIKVGALAGTPARRGYIKIQVDGRPYLAHRLVWLHYHGDLPDGDVDHVNMDTANNSITNLRQATRSQNGANRGRNINNTSGFKGVQLHRNTGKYEARIGKGGARLYLGLFDTAALAHAAYSKAAEAAFGSFARVA